METGIITQYWQTHQISQCENHNYTACSSRRQHEGHAKFQPKVMMRGIELKLHFGQISSSTHRSRLFPYCFASFTRTYGVLHSFVHGELTCQLLQQSMITVRCDVSFYNISLFTSAVREFSFFFFPNREMNVKIAIFQCFRKKLLPKQLQPTQMIIIRCCFTISRWPLVPLGIETLQLLSSISWTTKRRRFKIIVEVVRRLFVGVRTQIAHIEVVLQRERWINFRHVLFRLRGYSKQVRMRLLTIRPSVRPRFPHSSRSFDSSASIRNWTERKPKSNQAKREDWVLGVAAIDGLW